MLSLNPTGHVRTPIVLQMEAVECGAAALGSILAYHGKTVPLTELREECGVSRHGVDAFNLCRAARRHGLEARGMKLDVPALREQPCPFVVHWEFNHFLVVEGFEPDRVRVNDPQSGRYTVSFEEFDRAFTGVALLFTPGPDFAKGGKPPPVWQLVTEPLRRFALPVACCVVAGLLLIVPGLAIPTFTQVFVDSVLVEERQHWLRPLLLGMAVVVVLHVVARLLQMRSERYVRSQLAMAMSSRFMAKILRLPTAFFGHRSPGEIASRVQLNDHVAGFAAGPLADLSIQIVLLIVYAMVMLSYDVWLTGIALVSAGCSFWLLRSSTRRLFDFHMRHMQEQGRLEGAAVTGLQSIETLKASGQEDGFFAQWAGGYARTLGASQELGIASAWLEVVPRLLAALTGAALLVVGGVRVMNGDLSIGMLVAFQALMLSFQAPLQRLAQLSLDIQEMHVNLARLQDVHANREDPEAERPLTLPPVNGSPHGPREIPHADREDYGDGKQLQGHVELRDVSFGYHLLDPPLIDGLSLTIAPAQRIALVGATGSGKSTVAKLVAGLLQPWHGAIFIDGRPRQTIPRAVLAGSLAYVEQDYVFFMGSVEDNLTLWDRSLSLDRLQQSCADALIADAIAALPGGFAGELAEGASNLSGGQRQRLEIARALVRNPRILILDEATSALDPETEQQLDDSLRRRGCACLIIAHRLSTIRDCDEIIVLSEGKAVERGRHEDLLRQGGEYARLIGSDRKEPGHA